jgi:large repetitive protein
MRPAPGLLALSFLVITAACGDNVRGNSPPRISGGSVTTAEDTPVTIDLGATDPDGDRLVITVSGAAHGSVAVAADRATYTPDPDYHGPDSIEVTVSDGDARARATFAITVTPVNDPPVGAPDSIATDEDTAVVVDVVTLLANDRDVDGDPLTITDVGGAVDGTVEIDGDQVTFAPAADFSGDATFEYTLSDGSATAVVTVTVTVGDANDPPTAVDDTVTTPEDTAAVIPAADLLANDTDPDGDVLTIVAVGAAVDGDVVLDGTTITFTPDPDFDGSASFEYTVSDGELTDVGLVTVVVTGAGDGPIAGDDEVTTDEDTAVEIAAADLLANDVDPDGDPLTVTEVGNAVDGTVALDGTTITFTPDPDFFGEASFAYTVSDGDLDDVGRVTVTVTPVNDAPVAGDDLATTAEDTPLELAAATLLGNDTDVESDPLTVTAVGTQVNGTVALAGTTITFTPAADFFGVASFVYTVSDGDLTDTGVVTVTVTPVNDAPVAADDAAATDEDTPVELAAAALLANDTDVDTATLTITAVGGAVDGAVTLAGTVITFTPAPDFFGDASFSYTVSDGALTDTATVTVTVAPVNDAPVAADDTATTDQDTAIDLATAALLANDTDVDSAVLTVTEVGAAVNGEATLAGTTVTFTPDAGFVGTASFAYTVSDGELTDAGVVVVTVVPDNTAPPVANADLVTIDEDTVATIPHGELLANDVDPDGGALTIIAVGNPINGTVVLGATTVTFTPTADFFGAASFEYTISDGELTDVGVVAVTVAPVNDAPVAVDDTATTAEDTAIDIPTAAVLANDTDVDSGALTVQAVGNPAGGTVVLVGATITFTPAADFHGAASFEYVVSDGELADVGVVSVTVTPTPDAPVAGADVVTTDEDTAAVILHATLLGNDADADGDALSIVEVHDPVNGTVVLDATTVTFTPAADFFGIASFMYTVSDGALVGHGVVTVVVAPVNDAPIAVDDAATTPEDVALVIPHDDLLGNDTDVDSGTLTITGVGAAVNGAVTLGAAVVTFTPAANFHGTASFEYTVSDGGLTDTGLVTVTITPVPDAPIAVADAATTAEDTPLIIDAAALLANDTDPDGDALTVTAVASPVNGVVSLAGTTITFAPDPNFHGDASFLYTVSDGALDATGVVTVTVTPVDECGDAEPGAGEECDDGNDDDTDGCTTQCFAGVVCADTEHPDGDGFAVDARTGHCYVRFDGGLTFDDARAACQAAGGDLATITDADEDAAVAGALTAGANPWIGAIDDDVDDDDVFAWVTGEPWGYARFAPGQPDDDAGIGGNGECLHIVNDDGEWNDTNCDLDTFVTSSLCELAPDETLFVSEYVEGTSNNKAIEIRNPLLTAIDLAAASCSLQLFFNGGATPSQTINLTGTVAAGEVYVVAHSSAVAALRDPADQLSGALTFNGNDAIALVCGGDRIDVFGQIGNDPGATGWGGQTTDRTLRRRCGIVRGDPDGTDAFVPSIEWGVLPVDTFTGIGVASCAP